MSCCFGVVFKHFFWCNHGITLDLIWLGETDVNSMSIQTHIFFILVDVFKIYLHTVFLIDLIDLIRVGVSSWGSTLYLRGFLVLQVGGWWGPFKGRLTYSPRLRRVLEHQWPLGASHGSWDDVTSTSGLSHKKPPWGVNVQPRKFNEWNAHDGFQVRFISFSFKGLNILGEPFVKTPWYKLLPNNWGSWQLKGAIPVVA